MERIDGMLLMLLTLPGVAVTYNGEEIGMVDYRDISYEDSRDPQGCNVGPDEYQWKSRDPQRTPFQWDDTYNAGFSKAERPWLPVHPYFRQTNLLKQKEADYSTYKFYVDAVKLRKNDVYSHGLFKSRALSENVFGFVRYIKDQQDSYHITVVNLANEVTTVDLLDLFQVTNKTAIKLTGTESRFKVGQQVNPTRLTLGPYESLVIAESSGIALRMTLWLMVAVLARYLCAIIESQ